MRFVPAKTEEQQSVLVLHRSRDLLMRQRTMILNAIRAQLAESEGSPIEAKTTVTKDAGESRASEDTAKRASRKYAAPPEAPAGPPVGRA